MIGPGKYDDLATQVREQAKANAVILVVFHGIHGSGFSAQLPPGTTEYIPGLLREMADQIEYDAKHQN